MFEKLKFIASTAWEFLKPFIKLLLTKAGRILAVSAMNAVTIVAASLVDSSGSEKRQAAFDLIVDDLKSQGIALGASVINLAIETAVSHLKPTAE